MGKDKESDDDVATAAEDKTEKETKKKKGKKDDKDKEKAGDGDEDGDKSKEKSEDKKPKEADEGIDADNDGTAETTVTKTDRSTLSDKKQDFQMRIKVICGRQLAGSNIKPIVKVKAGKGQIKTTRCRKGSSPIWNELLVFNMNESLKDLYDFIIQFTVNNSRKLRSDSLIGSFKLDLGSVYDQPGHAYVRKWLLLTDLEDTSNNPTGYLKVTICILGPGNQPPDDKSDDDDDDVEGNLLTPAGAALKTSNFCLRVYSAEDLPQMSGLGFKGLKILGGSSESSSETSKKTVNSYFTLGFAGRKRKTKKAKETNSPEWNVELNLPFKFPSMCDGIKLCLKNKQPLYLVQIFTRSGMDLSRSLSDLDQRKWQSGVKLGHDDAIGTAMMLLSAISSTGDGSGSDEGFLPTFGPTFVNFYGSPREYDKKDDALEPLNTGKGEGCAYRGRAMMELVTTLEEEDGESVSPRKEIGEEALELVKKYYRRRRYRLVVGFESASMIEKNYQDLEFEVSMGNYGNKFDAESKSACSVTEPISTTFDDCKYYYAPWTTKKPILMLTSQWEETNFRFFAVNLIGWICDKISTEIKNIRRQIRNKEPEADIAASLVELLDVIILETSKRLPDPKDQPTANELDSLLYEQRTKVLVDVAADATALRQECTDSLQAVDSIVQFSERLQSVAYEPQNNIPDILVWMLSGKKRIAYYRIPAQDILFSPTDPHFSGKHCSKPQSIFLKTPNAKPNSKKRYQFPCQVRLVAWLGLAQEQDGFDLNTDGKITICAETYEVESKIPLKGWIADGFKDKSGEIPLSKESFTCPEGWQWEDDWELSSELHLLRDSGHSSFMEECFVYESRFTELDWEPEKVVNSAGKTVESFESILCLKGWTWEDPWKVDTDRACDEDGWEYTVPSDDQGTTAWSSTEKDFHLLRRKRMIRYRRLVDPKVLKKEAKKETKMGELWEYGSSMSGKFHLESKSLDMVRRRKWIRRMVTSGTQKDSAIFSLDKSVVKSWSFLESLKVISAPDSLAPEDQQEPSGSGLATIDAAEVDPSIAEMKGQTEDLQEKEDERQEELLPLEDASLDEDDKTIHKVASGVIKEKAENLDEEEISVDQSASTQETEEQMSSSEENQPTRRSTKSEPFIVPLRAADEDVNLENEQKTTTDKKDATRSRGEKSKSVDFGKLSLEKPVTDERPLSSEEDQKYKGVATKKQDGQQEKKKVLETVSKFKSLLSPKHIKKSKKADKRDSNIEATTDDEKSSDGATLDGSTEALDKTTAVSSTPSPYLSLPDGSTRDKPQLSAESEEKLDKVSDLPSKIDADTNMEVALQKKKKVSTAFMKAARKSKNKLSGPKIYLMFENAYQLQLRGYIYQGRDLLPMAKNNFSDPVIFVSFLNHCRRSIVINHTLNPIWDQTLIMDITLYGDLRLLQEYCSKVVLEVFHANEAKKISITPFKSKPKNSSKPIKGDLKLMGRSFGRPDIKLSGETEKKARLEWLDVSKGDSDGGCILAAFDLFMKDESQDFPVLPPRHTNKKYNDLFIVPYGIRPMLQRTAVEILVWGVRNMQPFKILNVDTPLVLIQIGEVEVRTKPLKNAKKHPNYPQPFHLITANLPVEEIYFPPIVIRVKDNRKFGRRPTVGQHVITDVTKYRREPLEPKLTFSGSDDGFEDVNSLDDNESVSIEVEKPEEHKEPKEKSTSMFDRLKQVATLPTLLKKDEPVSEEAQDIDWWSKYYASVGDKDKSGDFEKSGLCYIKVYKNELEKQENFNNFSDYIETFNLSRGKSKDDEDPEFTGEFKGAFRIYRLPEDPDDPMPPPFYEIPFMNDTQELVVRVYVVCGVDLAAQNSNGLADPYIKIKSGKRRIEDKKNYIPNTLNPTFGRMFELEVKLPIQKDLFVQVYDWNLIGTDDKIGETVIDLENRFYSKYKAWCGLPEVYETTGPTPWRDQMTPKEMLYEMARKEGWDEPVWNGNTCISVNRKHYRLNQFELNMKPSAYWGEAEERLCLHVLRSFPHVSEHVETRPIFSKQMPGIEQGRLQLWVDMFPKRFGPPGLPFDISPRKPSKYFLRVIIWNCSDIPMVSTSFSGDKMTDIYLKGWMTGLEYKRQKTDVHYRSMDGTGNFNWRFIFPFDYIPQERLVHVSKKRHVWSMDKTVSKFPPVLTIQVWNNDLFRPNDYLSEVTLPLLHMPKCCKFKRSCTIENVPDFQGNCKMEMVSLYEQKVLKGWWPLYKMVNGKKEQSGKVEMSVEVVTEVEHEERPAAKARNEPNLNPKLDKPKRPATSFAWFSNPLKSLRYIIWRKYKWYIIAILILLPIVAFIVLLFYNLPSTVLRLL